MLTICCIVNNITIYGQFFERIYNRREVLKMLFFGTFIYLKDI